MVSANVNSVASKFKFNGVELEESLGLDLYEMDLRQYDPAIVRFTSIDPVTHFSYSTYAAFDNNPIFWADPSGADSIYNWDTGQYVINGQEVSFNEAVSYAGNGGNSDGSNNNNAYEITLPNIRNDELSKNKSSHELGCQQGDCYDPVDFKNDSDDEIYKKLLNNITTFVKAKNKAIRTGETMATVYIEELIRLDNIYGDIHKSSGEIIDKSITYSGGTIDIIALPVTNDEIVGYHFEGANRRMSGSKMYYSYEVHLVGDYRNTVKDWESTSITPDAASLRSR